MGFTSVPKTTLPQSDSTGWDSETTLPQSDFTGWDSETTLPHTGWDSETTLWDSEIHWLLVGWSLSHRVISLSQPVKSLISNPRPQVSYISLAQMLIYSLKFNLR